jgi:PPK2 family polyphosphate:nucleotide phosphotransferase
MDFEHRFRVPETGFHLADQDPADVAGLTKDDARVLREANAQRLAELQERLYAEGRQALLVVMQGLDASGKDGTVKHVMGAMNPAGLSVTSFKSPSAIERAHDFLWREQVALPPRGHVGVFNRSHYEEVVTVRVHPELLSGEASDPSRARDATFWERRFEDIVAWERHLTREGTRVVKFFLHISRAEQRRRFLARAERPDKQWKFSVDDVREQRFRDEYQRAYQAALRATSTADTPWYVIPADHKWFERTAVGAIMVSHLDAMHPRFPTPTAEDRAAMLVAIAELRAED